MGSFRLVAGAIAFAVGVLVGVVACSGAGSTPTPTPSPLNGWEDRLDLGLPGDVVDVVSPVGYYPACGNEVLHFTDSVWFPFRPSNVENFPNPNNAVLDQLSMSAEEAPRGMSRGALPAVAAPGPGDDVGVLVIYEGGLAHWSSDSGHLDTWLTTRPLTYAWEC